MQGHPSQWQQQYPGANPQFPQQQLPVSQQTYGQPNVNPNYYVPATYPYPYNNYPYNTTPWVTPNAMYAQNPFPLQQNVQQVHPGYPATNIPGSHVPSTIPLQQTPPVNIGTASSSTSSPITPRTGVTPNINVATMDASNINNTPPSGTPPYTQQFHQQYASSPTQQQYMQYQFAQQQQQLLYAQQPMVHQAQQIPSPVHHQQVQPANSLQSSPLHQAQPIAHVGQNQPQFNSFQGTPAITSASSTLADLDTDEFIGYQQSTGTFEDSSKLPSPTPSSTPQQTATALDNNNPQGDKGKKGSRHAFNWTSEKSYEGIFSEVQPQAPSAEKSTTSPSSLPPTAAPTTGSGISTAQLPTQQPQVMVTPATVPVQIQGQWGVQQPMTQFPQMPTGLFYSPQANQTNPFLNYGVPHILPTLNQSTSNTNVPTMLNVYSIGDQALQHQTNPTGITPTSITSPIQEDFGEFTSHSEDSFGDFTSAETSGSLSPRKQGNSFQEPTVQYSAGPQGSSTSQGFAQPSVSAKSSVKIETAHVRAWEKGLDRCQLELEKGQDMITKATNCDEKDIVFQSDKFRTYLKGLLEIYRVACRLKTVLNVNESCLSLCASPMTTLFLLDKVDNTWDSIKALVDSPAIKEFVYDAPKLNGNSTHCSYCLLPVEGNESALMWESQSYHCGCANFWANCISATAPHSA